MTTRTYPGEGLSLSQLVFALNKELKRVAFSPSVTCDQVSQLDHDTLAALVIIREWKNSFTPVNRLPLDILSLVPTHLVSQQDRFRASSVCRHWRRTFLQRADLWTELLLSKGEIYTKTMLERTKGSALIAHVGHGYHRRVSASTMMLLSSHTQRIKRLSIANRGWADIKRFAEVSGFRLLDSLTINTVGEDGPGVLGPTCLFGTAVDLKQFRLYSMSPPLNHFFFPSLVKFHLSAEPSEALHALQLFDFLEASPMLQKVEMDIATDISLEGVPQGRVIVLPNVEHLNLSMVDGGPGYRLAAHMSCPSARYTSFEHRGDTDEPMDGLFPPPDLWNAIVHQYARNPAEEISIEFRPHSTSTCILTLRSPDASIIELRFKFVDEDEEIREFPDGVMNGTFVQAAKVVQNHPQLPNVKRLRICYRTLVLGFDELSCVADGVGQLFRSLGRLDELTIHNTDLRPYIYTVLDFIQGQTQANDTIIYPSIKQFTISHPRYQTAVECTTAIAGLAKLQSVSGVPFERVVVRGRMKPTEMEEKIGPWVGSVEYCYEEFCDPEDSESDD